MVSHLSSARILTLDEFTIIRHGLEKVVCVSGGFDPLHSGHISHFFEAKKLGAILVVIVNGDNFLRKKKGMPFMNLDERCRIISALKPVDYVIPFEIEDDQTVNRALEKVVPDVFAKGKDRNDIHTIPEWHVCQRLKIKIETNVGSEHINSSDFLNAWIRHNSRTEPSR